MTISSMSNGRKSNRRSRHRSPPTSLPDHFSRKGYLSVSDLVGPSWCEYNYQYGILSLSHLPPALRPATITTEAGQSLTASASLVAQKEKTLDAGKAVHTVLEKEVAPVQVYVETETKEDSWALRLLNLWCDVQGLLRLDPGDGKRGRNRGKGKGRENSCVREIPVYGWIHGVLVMGVVDEIEKRTMERNGDGAGKDKEKAKVWASQEEWKKDQLRQKSSPKKAKAPAPTRTLASFFGSQPPSSSQEKEEKQEDPPPAREPGWGYFLSDTKTRISSWLPAEEDQFSARMQCMTYKRLFDGLLLGALSFSSTHSPRDLFDPNATPMDWSHTFASLDLDPHQPLSEPFLRDAVPLCESWGTDLALLVAKQGADVCTLDHVRLLLEEGLRELIADARKGQRKGEEEGKEGMTVIQDRLALTYRRQKRGRRKKRKQPALTGSDAKEVQDGMRQTTLDDTTTTQPEEGSDKVAEEPARDESISTDTIGEPRDAPAPNTTALEPIPDPEGPEEPAPETRKSIDALEGRNDASHAIEQALSSPPPSTPKKPSASQSTPAPSSPTSPDETQADIIGIVTFSHDPPTLDIYLHKMISMWKGERELVGVSVDQTRRCWTCEWMDGCEWRTSQSHQHQQQRERMRSTPQIELAEEPGEEGEEEFWSTLDYESIQVKDSAGNVLEW